MPAPRHAPRTTVVTGAASGIGRATAALLTSRGQRVIGIDRSGTAIEADLSTPAGRAHAIVAACLGQDEPQARALAAAPTDTEPGHRQGQICAASKRALMRWIRRTAARPEWAGAGILLNGVAPGLVRTPMTLPLLATAEGRAVLARAVPRAVADAAEPEDVALLLAFLASPDNRCLVGQVPYCHGGTDVLMRGDAPS